MLSLWFALTFAHAAPPMADAAPIHTQLGQIRRPADKEPMAIRATWPDGDGPFPIIVFSHGMGGDENRYLPLTEYWASHGYLVLQPAHGGADEIQAVRDANPRGTLEDWANAPATIATVAKRPGELSLVLDRAEDFIRSVPGLLEKVDREHIGVGGHSFGAHTAMMIGGMYLTNPVNGKEMSFADDRVDALVVISPQGTSPAMPATAWRDMAAPTLMVIGSEERSIRQGKGSEWRLEAFSHLRNGWLLWIDGADHGFGGIAGRKPQSTADVQTLRTVQETTLAFWDATLKDQKDSRKWLDTDQVRAETEGVAHLKRAGAKGKKR